MLLIDMIRSDEPAVRNQSLASACRGLSFADLLGERESLDRFRRESGNLYHRVRALFFIYAIDRFHLPARPEMSAKGHIPYAGVERLLADASMKRSESFARKSLGAARATRSAALAVAYQSLAFQTRAIRSRERSRPLPESVDVRTGSSEEHPCAFARNSLVLVRTAPFQPSASERRSEWTFRIPVERHLLPRNGLPGRRV